MPTRKVINRYNYFLKKSFVAIPVGTKEFEVQINVPFTVDEMKVRNVVNIAILDEDQTTDGFDHFVTPCYAYMLRMSRVGDLCAITHNSNSDVDITHKIGEKMTGPFQFTICNMSNDPVDFSNLQSTMSVHLEFLSYAGADSF